VDVEAQNRRLSRKQKKLISRNFAEPSDGLEPSTPSLPWGGTGVHGRASAGTLFLQIKPLSCVSGARACPLVLNLMYLSRTRALLSVFKTHNVDRRYD
jgi:hypothetical protein